MKKIAMITAAALGVLAACSKTEVKPQQPETPVDDTAPVAVQFGLAAPQSTVSTKASGTVGGITDDTNVWNGQTVYVMGFVRSTEDFTNAATDAFIWNIKAVATASPDDGSKAPLEVLNPNPDPDASGQQTPEPFYFQGDEVYDFYGYYIDDAYLDEEDSPADPVPVSEASRIYVPFTINGGQALMVAMADPADDIKGTEVKNPANAYSAYAARRGVQPTLPFEHQLARFTFEIVPGSASANTIQVESIKIQSKTKGNLVVVGENRGIQDVDAESVAWLSLMQKSVDSPAPGALEPLTPVAPATFKAEPDAIQDTVSVGESIMVIPGEATYDLEYTLRSSDDAVTTPIATQNWTLDAAALVNKDNTNISATKFEAGKSYKVTIKIYGLEKVEITASLQGWEDGGNIVVDPDQPPAGNDSDPDAGDDSENTGGTEVTVP